MAGQWDPTHLAPDLLFSTGKTQRKRWFSWIFPACICLHRLLALTTPFVVANKDRNVQPLSKWRTVNPIHLGHYSILPYFAGAFIMLRPTKKAAAASKHFLVAVAADRAPSWLGIDWTATWRPCSSSTGLWWTWPCLGSRRCRFGAGWVLVEFWAPFCPDTNWCGNQMKSDVTVFQYFRDSMVLRLFPVDTRKKPDAERCFVGIWCLVSFLFPNSLTRKFLSRVRYILPERNTCCKLFLRILSQRTLRHFSPRNWSFFPPSHEVSFLTVKLPIDGVVMIIRIQFFGFRPGTNTIRFATSVNGSSW